MQYIQREDVRADRLALVSEAAAIKKRIHEQHPAAEANRVRRELPPQHETRRDPRGPQRRPFSTAHSLVQDQLTPLSLQTNILISDEGNALISDFGLSTVVEELSLTDATLRAAQLGTSLLAGSTRWMAPELILSLVEDDDGVPCPVTRESDVFSFACVCLEVCVVASCVTPFFFFFFQRWSWS